MGVGGRSRRRRLAGARVTPLVVVDADVLGRERTGDETYVLNLLRELAPLAPAAGIRIAAVARDPGLVPDGIEAVRLGTPFQELRLAVTLPGLLRKLGTALGHFQYALPLALPCPAVVTIHDLSFEREPSLMSRKDRFVFHKVVPRAARQAVRVLTVSERTRRDLRELYDVPDEKIVVTPNGVDPAFTPGDGLHDYVLLVGAVQERKNPLAALAAADAAGLPLVVAGPAKDEALALELGRRGARVTGYVEQDELVRLYRGAACLVQSSRYEGFGLPVLEAMACGTPVVAVPEPALREVAGDAAVWADECELADGIRRAVAERERLVAAGLERARLFSWRETARRTLDVYREALPR
jgi:glycosyltransferase involved in cell wall biosynthesis